MKPANHIGRIVALALSTAPLGVVAAEAIGVVASVELASGAHAGKYTYEASDACIIAASEKNTPPGFSVTVLSDRSQLSIDMPNVEAAHANELQIELVVADVQPNQSRKNTATRTYTIDTRPDSALARYQLDERAGKGPQGKATAELTQNADSARLVFTAQTNDGVKITGSIDCRQVDRAFGR